LFHRHPSYYAQPLGGVSASQPLLFQLPGGFGVNVDLQQLLSQLVGQRGGGGAGGAGDAGKSTPIQITPDVVKKVNDIQSQVNDGVDEINKLTERMNKKLKANPKLVPDGLPGGQFVPLEKLNMSSGQRPSGGPGVSKGPFD
jgi:hypothetical protein